MNPPRLVHAIVLLCFTAAFTWAAPPDGTITPLWPEGVPGQLDPLPDETFEGGWYRHVNSPSMTYVTPAPDRPSGTAVIICPGGGYGGLAWDREGIQYARWLSGLGVSSFILKYRLGDYGHPAPLQDVLRAVRLVRRNAEEYGINPERIGIMGSSAGGHLAASASTLFDHTDGRTGDALDTVSARPDFAILMYPVISMADGVTHNGSRRNLIGEPPRGSLFELMSLENQVTANTPPTLIIHTQPDQAVPVENAIRYFQALTRHEVPGELYVFTTGSHGMGIRPGLGTASDWPARAAEWLFDRGLIER